MSNADRRALRLGTRGSKLALAQSTWVAEQLRGRGHTVEIVEIKTQGDLQQQPSLAEVSQATGTQGLFTKELQRALLDETVDFAVHSMKDLPTEPIKGLGVAAIPEREMANDVLVGPFASIAELPQRARVGTGSLRRRAQLLHARPDLVVLGLRGNVDTRLRKLAAGNYDAIVLAGAGLHRLGLI
ncbi:MAG: hydroxymethylbilane synthase, partial [Planctomycetota bacterium]